LHAQVLGGRVTVPDDDATGAMYELAMQHFADAGYAQYEISNWASNDFRLPILDFGLSNTHSNGSSSKIQNPKSKIPNQACHHNLAYWLNTDYLACGAGAHGHVFPQRYYDVLGVDDYIRALREGRLPTAETINLTQRDLYAETMFMGLRLNVGVNYAHFRDRCGAELDEVYGETLDELERLELIERDELGVRLTDRGRMLGNQVFSRFV
jgi:oxygen-independent coproporphyrinogen-3 oxidase